MISGRRYHKNWKPVSKYLKHQWSFYQLQEEPPAKMPAFVDNLALAKAVEAAAIPVEAPAPAG
jgi:hypothetical protein